MFKQTISFITIAAMMMMSGAAAQETTATSSLRGANVSIQLTLRVPMNE